MINKMFRKKAQEEMIGFALIIILVSVILLAFLGFSLSKTPRDLVESYEVENFIQAFLQYTTECEKGFAEYFSVQDLIFECDLKNECPNEEKTACEVLNNTLNDVLGEAWPVGEDRPNKGYELSIETEDKRILNILEGNITRNFKGASQTFSKRRTNFDIVFKAYF